MTQITKRPAKVLYKAQVEGAKLIAKKQRVQTQADVFKRAGLDDVAKRLTPVLNELTYEIQQADNLAQEQHEECILATHLALVSCDLMTLVADKVAEIFTRCSVQSSKDPAMGFVSLITGIADEFNNVVQTIDLLPDDAGMIYADMAEFAVDGIVETLTERIQSYLQRPKTGCLK